MYEADGSQIKGTIRSVECDLKVGPQLEGHRRTSACHHCENLIKDQAFVKRIQRCNEKESRTAKTNDKSLSKENDRF